MLDHDGLARVLYVDLSRRSFTIKPRPELFEAGLGGAGVGIRLLEEECAPGTDPYAPGNPIILAVGPLTGLFPLASKTVAMFKSPHTGNLGESHAGGRSAIAIRMAGYGAIVIRGASTSPVYLSVQGSQVHFRDASALWGTHSAYTVGSVLRERESGAGVRSIMRIGRAARMGVSYASVISETYRHSAAWVWRRLRQQEAQGTRDRRAAVPARRRPPGLRQLYDELYKSDESPLMKKYHELGTAMNVMPLDAIGALPTRNLQQGRFEGAQAICGRLWPSSTWAGAWPAPCPVACIHLAAVRFPYPKEPYFYKTSMIGYDHEPIFAVGSLLGGTDVKGMFQLLDEASPGSRRDEHGRDPGMGDRGAAARDHLDEGDRRPGAGVGNYPAYLEAAARIVDQPNDFYRALAGGRPRRGTLRRADFALTFGGNEMPGYHTGPGAHLGYLTGARHSHLDSAATAGPESRRQGRDPGPDVVATELVKESAGARCSRAW